VITFTTEQDQYLQLAQTRAYYQGLRAGVQRAGITGSELADMSSEIAAEESEVLSKFEMMAK
jgi:hypothetical protein